MRDIFLSPCDTVGVALVVLMTGIGPRGVDDGDVLLLRMVAIPFNARETRERSSHRHRDQGLTSGNARLLFCRLDYRRERFPRSRGTAGSQREPGTPREQAFR